MKTINDLMQCLTEKEIKGDLAAVVTGLHYDSRKLAEGDLFICIEGFICDGHKFIPEALKNGAKALLVQKEVAVPSGITIIKVPDTRVALPLVAAAFYDHPSEKLQVVGVTGTNGKTTTTSLVEAILRSAGYLTGLIGTIHNKIGDQILPVERTTPESLEVQRMMGKMVEIGATHAVMEVSSHALDLHRVDCCDYDVAIFTNLTQDHLDYHKTIEAYFATKAKLFGKTRFAVINMDDPYGALLKERTEVATFTYGIREKADIRAEAIEVKLKGLSFQVITPVGSCKLQLNLTGLFNVYNVLAAIGAALALKVSLQEIKKALESVRGVAGRFQLVESGQDFAVVVDYAHTPDGLENILKTAQSFVQGRLITVFGCGGDRDKTKRPIMGKIGADYSDYMIITSDNPRTEDPTSIILDVEVGAKQGKCAYEVVVDRRKAIAKAIQIAGKEDLVMIAGKGHETYQVFKDKTIHFDDREIAEECLRGL